MTDLDKQKFTNKHFQVSSQNSETPEIASYDNEQTE